MWVIIVVFAILQLSTSHAIRAAKRQNVDFNYNTGASGSIRLISPAGSTRVQPWGIVQVLHNGVWGTVCQSSLRESTLQVVCRDMGADGGYRIGDDEFPTGDADSMYGPVTLENPQCSGTEASLLQCQHQGLGNANCRHWSDIKVQCYEAGDEQGERIRLVDSEGDIGGSSGRFEVMHNGVWGTVCNSYAHTTPHFLCAKLGYTGGEVMAREDVPAVSDVNGPIWLVGLSCTEPIDTVGDCVVGSNTGYGVLLHGNCYGHSNDLGLICEEDVADEGTLEQEEDGGLTVFHQGVWWQVCSVNFGYADSGVACRQLGYPDTEGTILPMSYESPPRAIWLSHIACEGDEERLVDCPMNEERVMCSAGRAAIRCDLAPQRGPGREGEIQLIDGVDVSQGRVEIFHDGEWGTICKGGMDRDEAEVICGELGHDTGKVNFKYWETYGARQGTPIMLDHVNCTGVAQANTITDCLHGDWGQTGCGRDEVVWVKCSNDSDEDDEYNY